MASSAAVGSNDGHFRPGETPVGGEAPEKDDGLQLASDHGSLNQRDVDDVLDKNRRVLTSCYGRAGDAQKFASGEITLRFLVSAKGEVSDVLVVANTVGNYAVERCLVVEGRRILFPPPGGHKDAQFDFPLVFRASGEVAVLEWDEEALSKEAGALGKELLACGSLGPEPVRAVIYIHPGGTVASAGLVSEGPVDATAGICALEQLHRWKFPDDREHVVKGSLNLVALAGPASGAHRAVKRAGRRKRR